MRNLLQSLKVIVLALVVGFGANFLYAQSVFTPPTVAPPGGNPPAPVNVGTTFQTKTGPFDVKGQMFVHALNPSNNQPYVTGFSVLNGNAGIGTANPSSKLQVMGLAKADDFCLNSDATKCLSSAGTGSGTGGVSKIVAGTGITVTPTTGIGEVTVGLDAASISGIPAGFKPAIVCSSILLGPNFQSPTATSLVLYYSYSGNFGSTPYHFYSAIPTIGRSPNATSWVPFSVIVGFNTSTGAYGIGYSGGSVNVLAQMPSAPSCQNPKI